MAIFFVFTLSIFIALAFQKKIEETFALSIMGVSLVLYAIGSFTSLKYTLWTAFLVSIAGCIYLYLKKRIHFKSLLSYDNLISVIIVLFFIVFFAIYSYGRDFMSPDDFYCWGWMTKGFYYNDTISAGYANGMQAGHPPLTTLWYYFVLKTWICFSDGICLWSHNIFMIACMLPVFTYVKKMRITDIVLTVLCVLCIPWIGETDAYLTITVDCLQGGIIFFLIYNMMKYWETHERYYYAGILTTSMSLILSKKSGIIFFAFFLFVFLVTEMYKNGLSMWKYDIAYLLIVSVLIYSWYESVIYAIMPFGVLLCGGVVVYAIERLGTFTDEKRKILRVLSVFALFFLVLVLYCAFSRLEEFPRACIRDMLYDAVSIFHKDYGIKPLPYIFYVVALFGYFINQKTAYKKVAIASIWCCMIFYYAILIYLEIVTIGPSNHFRTHVITRYLAPFEIFITLLFLLIICRSSIKKQYVRDVVFICYFLVVLVIGNAEAFLQSTLDKYQSIGYYAFKNAGIELNDDDVIYFVDELGEWEYRDREFYYSMYPAKTNFLFSSIFYSDGVGTLEYSLDEFTQILSKDYNYVYLQTIGKSFRRKYASLFKDSEDITPGTVYAVSKDNGGVLLTKIER